MRAPDQESAGRRNVILWITGTSASIFGDAALWIALGIWIKDLTGSDGAAGLAFMAYVLPRFAAPFLGLVVDRFRRRPLIILLNVMLAVWVTTAFLVHGNDDIWLLYVLLFGVGLGVGIHNAAGSALLTLLVPRDGLGRANAMMRTAQEAGMLAAPAVGAALYVAIGPHSIIAVESVTFLVCAACVWRVRVTEPIPPPAEGGLVAEVLAGIRHLVRTPRLRAVSLAMGGALLGFGFIETLIYTITDQGLHRPAAFVGVLTFAKSVGSVAGGALGIRVLRRFGPGNEARLTVFGLTLMAAGCGLLILPGLPAALAGVFVVGLGAPGAVVGLYTSVQHFSPPHLQGRVAAAASMFATTPQVVAVALSTVLVVRLNFHLILAGMVVLIGCSAGYLTIRLAAAPAASPPIAPDPATTASEG